MRWQTLTLWRSELREITEGLLGEHHERNTMSHSACPAFTLQVRCPGRQRFPELWGVLFQPVIDNKSDIWYRNTRFRNIRSNDNLVASSKVGFECSLFVRVGTVRVQRTNKPILATLQLSHAPLNFADVSNEDQDIASSIHPEQPVNGNIDRISWIIAH